MKKNGKFFVPPTSDGSNFKDLFKRLATAGAGRPVDEDGFPSGPWTPDLLAEAISQIDANRSGIELRTVQLWFQDNEKGISTDNIRWLARVFGCDDPEATSEWQMELSAAQRRFVAERRETRGGGNKSATEGHSKGRTQDSSLARKCEVLLGGQATLSLQVSLWAVYVAIGLLNFIFGVHSVTYSPIEGVDKQVGFLWAPTWTILPTIILPLYVAVVSELLSFWKDNRTRIAPENSEGWFTKVDSFSFSFWTITIVCIAFVFGFQWFGMYLRIYMQGDVGTFQIDRNLLSLVRPEIISTTQSLILSMLGFLYTALYIWILLLGLLFMYILAIDYAEVCRTYNNKQGVADWTVPVDSGKKLMDGVFRCSVLGLWFATCIKIQLVYLMSADENIVSWLTGDFLSALRLQQNEGGLLNQQSMTHFTTFLLLVLICISFYACMVKIQNVLGRLYADDRNDRTLDDQKERDPKTHKNYATFTMIGVVLFVTLSTLLIGQFVGFSVLLLISFAASVYCIVNPPLDRSWTR